MIETIAKGRLTEFQEAGIGRRAVIDHDGFRAVLSLFDNGKRKTWVLTGFEEWPEGIGGP